MRGGPTDVGLAGAGRGRRGRVFGDNADSFIFEILAQLHNPAGGIVHFKID